MDDFDNLTWIYHVQLWRDMTSDDDCIHSAIVDLGYYFNKLDALKIASQYKQEEQEQRITISEIPVYKRV